MHSVRVIVMPPFDREFFGGTDRFEITARTLFGLVNRLDEIGPGFADLADVRAAFAELPVAPGAMQLAAAWHYWTGR